MNKRTKTYIVDIAPVAWARPGQNGKTRYDAQKDEKVLFGLHINKEHKAEPQFNKPVAMDITYFFKYPKATDRVNMRWYSHRPDIDNLEKFLYDTLQSCGVISDDKIIVKVSQQKIYGDKAHVEFTITEL